MKAVDSFNPALGNQFSTYAFRCIRNSVISGLRERGKYQEKFADPWDLEQQITFDFKPVNSLLHVLTKLLEPRENERDSDRLDREFLKAHYLNGLTFQKIPLHVIAHVVVLQPHVSRNCHGLGYSPFDRHYLGNHYCFLFLRVLRCFSSPGLLSNKLEWYHFMVPGCPIRKSSDIKVICTSPKLIAAYHVLHRLWEPRHPPYALIYFLLCGEHRLKIKLFPIRQRTLYPDCQNNCEYIRNRTRSQNHRIHLCKERYFYKYLPVNLENKGVEPLIFPMVYRDALQLSLPIQSSLWRIRESNPWPHACKACALADWANSPMNVVVPSRLELLTPTLSV